MSIILPNLNHSFISPVPVPVPVPVPDSGSGSGSGFPCFPYAPQLGLNYPHRCIENKLTSINFSYISSDIYGN